MQISAGPIDAPSAFAQFQAEHGGAGNAGAIVVMTGHVRGTGADGRALQSMELQSYRSMTRSSIEKIAADAAARFDLIASAVHHRTGIMTPGETVVLVMTAARHRRDAFCAAEYLMDQLKSRAVLWKRETGVDGSSQWIEPTTDDAAALDRWRHLGN